MLARDVEGDLIIYRYELSLPEKRIGIRLPPDELAAIDGLISGQKEEMSRPVAIRRLVGMGLEKPGKRGT